MGLKVFGGEFVTAGSIIVRQHGTSFYPGENVGLGRDYTLYATADGRVKFAERNKRREVHVVPAA